MYSLERVNYFFIYRYDTLFLLRLKYTEFRWSCEVIIYQWQWVFPLRPLNSFFFPLQMQRFNCTSKGIECDVSKAKAVCGTDNQTYTTRCHLLRAQCAGHKVSLKHRGPCKGIFISDIHNISRQKKTNKQHFSPLNHLNAVVLDALSIALWKHLFL